jgi:hypothetical protein
MIEKYINHTIKHLENTKKSIKNSLLDNFYQLKIILKIINEIKNSNYSIDYSYANLQLDDPNLLKVDKLNIPLLRFKLLRLLIQPINLFSQKLNYLFYNQKVSNLCKLIEKVHEENNLNNFENLISLLKENHFLFEIIEKIFPFRQFKSTNYHLLPYWIHLMVSLYKNKIIFRIKISKEHLFNFEGSDKEKIKPCLIFQQKNNLNISKESFIGQKSTFY